MLSFIRRQLSATNLMVVAALIFAMAGGAFAATGGGKHRGHHHAHSAGHHGHAAKKGKHSKHGKQNAKRGPRGKQGPAGPAGATGPQGAVGLTGSPGAAGKQGAQGAPGTPGKDGTNGTNGESVNVSTIAEGEEGCEGRGGARFFNKTGEAEACNGVGAAGGGFPETLPEGMPEVGVGQEGLGGEETGAWSYVATKAEGFMPISFPIRLATPIGYDSTTERPHIFYITIEMQEKKSSPSYGNGLGKPGDEQYCWGDAAKPEAAAGYLCIFEGAAIGGTLKEAPIVSPPTADAAERTSILKSKNLESTGVTGAMVEFYAPTGLELTGTWALGGN